VVEPLYNNVARGNGGCGFCRPRGFWAGEESTATLYLLTHDAYGAVKVGIMRDRSPRLRHHKADGWTQLDKWSGLTMQQAYDGEQAVLHLWRSAGIPDAVPRAQMPHGGASETAPLDLVDLARTRDVIAATIASAELQD
jgi:hypothetical protein